ncbi:MAG: guanylate kinase [Candidatus Desulfaltia sp.]|nr:guanylate kinase [Candidatus Desulfaltia sp.]
MRKLFIISAPSGAGKTTLCREVMKRFKDITYSISYTTRMPRNGERDGIDYYFITKEEFKRKIENNKWAEWAEVYGNFYGTSAEFLDTCLASGKRILLDIDVQGTMQIKKLYPDSITIFIMPPSLEALKTRLKSRGTDTRQVVERRLEAAKKEMEKKDLYRHVIINDQLSRAVSELIKIIESYC